MYKYDVVYIRPRKITRGRTSYELVYSTFNFGSYLVSKYDLYDLVFDTTKYDLVVLRIPGLGCEAKLNPWKDFVKIKDIVNEKLKLNDTGLAEYSKTYGRSGYDIIQKMCQIRNRYSNLSATGSEPDVDQVLTGSDLIE